MKGYLLLSDGTKLEGQLIGAVQHAIGEIVFNTGMTGYQEIVTDPSYYGQIVVLTYPMIGNYGVSASRNQSKSVQVKGLVVREINDVASNWSSEGTFEDYLLSHNLVAITGIDTRHLTKLIRSKGHLKAQIVMDKPVEFDTFENVFPVKNVTTTDAYELGEGDYKIAVYDFGIKQSILDQLMSKNFRLKVFPSDTPFDDIKLYEPDGIFLSNGPGDPSELEEVVDEIKSLVHYKPIFGICLGHQLIAKAFGAETMKLKYGHRGSNHPVKDISKDRVYITSQNHGYVVDKNSVDQLPLTVTHYNVNDYSIEGLKHHDYPIFSVQYHPEASPGPHDSNYLFDEFESLVKKEVTSC